MYLFLMFVLFLVWLNLKRAQTEKKEREAQEAFWRREEEANATRRKDISMLPYIRIPLEQLPLGIRPEDEELCRYEAQIKELAQMKILNLSGKTNTDLKADYGAANLTILSDCDQRFTDLIRLMQQWGQRLYDLFLTGEAALVLSQSVAWGSDIKNSYLLLCRIYKEKQDTDAIARLIGQAENLDSPRKDAILESLKELAA